MAEAGTGVELRRLGARAGHRRRRARRGWSARRGSTGSSARARVGAARAAPSALPGRAGARALGFRPSRAAAPLRRPDLRRHRLVVGARRARRAWPGLDRGEPRPTSSWRSRIDHRRGAHLYVRRRNELVGSGAAGRVGSRRGEPREYAVTVDAPAGRRPCRAGRAPRRLADLPARPAGRRAAGPPRRGRRAWVTETHLDLTDPASRRAGRRAGVPRPRMGAAATCSRPRSSAACRARRGQRAHLRAGGRATAASSTRASAAWRGVDVEAGRESARLVTAVDPRHRWPVAPARGLLAARARSSPRGQILHPSIGRASPIRPTAMRTYVRVLRRAPRHSAFSFLDGDVPAEELAAAALERGHEALALTDHDTLSGSMEFAQAASALGLRAIHGAEVTLDDGVTSPCSSATPTGWASLCRLLTRAHAHTRDHPSRRILGTPEAGLDDVEAHAEGLVCLSGCARQGVRDEPTLRRLLRAFGRDAFRIELQRPFARHDRALNRELAVAGGPPRRPLRGHGQRPRPRVGARAAAGRLRRHPRAHDARRLRAPAPRQPRARARLAAGDGRPLRRPSRGGGRDRAPGRHAALRPHAGPRLPLPRRGGSTARTRRWPRSARRASTSAMRPVTGCAPRPPRAWSRSCA